MTITYPTTTTAEVQVISFSLREHFAKDSNKDVIQEIAEKVTLLKESIMTRSDALNEITEIIRSDFSISKDEAEALTNDILTVLGKPA